MKPDEDLRGAHEVLSTLTEKKADEVERGAALEQERASLSEDAAAVCDKWISQFVPMVLEMY